MRSEIFRHNLTIQDIFIYRVSCISPRRCFRLTEQTRRHGAFPLLFIEPIYPKADTCTLPKRP